MRRKTNTKGVIRVHSRTARLILITATAAIVALGGLASFFSYMSIVRTEMQDFTLKSESAQASFVNGLNDYSDLLYTGRGFLQTRSTANTQEWNDFFHNQGIFDDYKGVEEISYVKIVGAQEAPKTIQTIRSGLQKQNLKIIPEGEREQYALGVLLSSEKISDINSIYDSYADPAQRQAYDSAIKTQQPTASPPFTLESGDRGFFIALPNFHNAALDGFIVLTLRVQDLIPSLINSEEALTYEVRDIGGEDPSPMYISPGWSYNNALSTVSFATVGSRTWRIEMAQVNSQQPVSYYILPLLIFLATIIVALIMVAEVHRIAVRKRNQIL